MNVKGTIANAYIQDIYTNVYRYAYENAEIGKLIIEGTTEWNGDIFLTSNIDSTLHYDIIKYLKENKMYYEIKKRCNKFIVLPDVFSELIYPISNYKINEVDGKGIKDYGVPNIVIMNGYIFELLDEHIGGIKFNYAGKMYYFYDSTKQYAYLIEEKPASLKVLNTKTYGEFDFDEKYPIGTKLEGSYLLQLDIFNKITEDFQLHNYLNLEIKYPCYVFDYDSKRVLKPSTIKGLYSVNPLDVFIQEHLIDERENKFIMHDRSMIFTETVIVIFNDNTYKIINDTFSPYVNRIDKHTIEFYKQDGVKQIVVFYKPIHFDPSVERVDSLYDDVMKITEYGYYELRRYKKNTTYLYNWLLRKRPNLDELIEYGYKYDLDVLYAVQKAFPLIRKIPYTNLEVRKLDYNGRGNKKNQLFLTVPNMLNLTPVVFIDGLLFDSDNRIQSISPDTTSIHLNVSRWNPELNNILKNSQNPQESVREWFKNKEIKVAYLTYVKSGENTLMYPIEHKPVIDKTTPATMISKSEIIDNLHSTFFVNGRACIKSSDNLYPLIYNQYVYDIGMHDDCKVQLLFNKIKDTQTRFMKLSTASPYIDYTFTEETAGLISREHYFSENATLAFSEDGKLCDEKINILTSSNMAIDHSLNEFENEVPSIRVIRLPRVNNILGIDFEIDYSKVDLDLNIGSYNDKSIEHNPDILRYFRLGSNFVKGQMPTKWSNEDSKRIGDLLCTFGSVLNQPFNIVDYKQFLDINNIDIINRTDILPNEDLIPTEVKYMYKPYNLAQIVFSNMLVANVIGKTIINSVLVQDADIDKIPKFKQMEHHINRGLMIGGESKLILLDIDREFTFTEDFNNPPKYDFGDHLKYQKISLDYGFDESKVIELPPIAVDLEHGVALEKAEDLNENMNLHIGADDIRNIKICETIDMTKTLHKDGEE